MWHGRGRIRTDLTQVLDHPMRLRILELHRSDKGRSLAADELATDLEALGEEVESVGQVAYHLARLTDVDLLPLAASG